jgi:hypothetical protein
MSAMTIAVAVRPETVPADARLEVDVLKLDLLKLDSLIFPQPGFCITGRDRPKFNRLLSFLTGEKVRFGSVATERRQRFRVRF